MFGINRFRLGALGGSPTRKPTLNLNFIGSSSVDSRITFTRASNATYFDSTGTLQTASNDVARLDYDPSTLAARGLLIEEQRTNLLTYSAEFDNAAWNKSGATISQDSSSAPDGNTVADSLVEDGTTGLHLAQQFIAFNNATAYTVSVYVKASTRTWVRILLPGAAFTSSQGSFFNLTGAGSLGAAVGSPTSRTINALNNGWYRVTVTATSTAAASGNVSITAASADSTTSYAGSNGSTALILWGAQLEAGAFATSYIPTTAASATRNADAASMTGTNFSSWYNATEGTVYTEASVPTPAAYTGYAMVIGVFNDGILYYRQNDSQPVNRIRASSADQFINGFGATWTTTATVKNALAYKANDFAGSVNGGTVATDTSGTVPTVSVLYIGARGTSDFFNGYIRRLAYYPRRLANAELQSITS